MKHGEARPDVEHAIGLMADFADRTGLTSERPPRRYLWTDAFAVCNYLGLAAATGDPAYERLAVRLIAQVHETLAHQRADDPRQGWLSGLDEPEGRDRPTVGGLRIGKAHPERRSDEAYDARREWERDGQYFHYLTKWMHALDQTTRATGQLRFNRWALDLAETAHDAFVYDSGRERRMHWKMSIDLSRPLVSSMGQHDPLDGYLTYLQLTSTTSRTADPGRPPRLARHVEVLDAMVDEASLPTSDPLGIGGLLVDAVRGVQLMREGAPLTAARIEAVLRGALSGLEHFVQEDTIEGPASQRLAFRELGLAIGLHAIDLVQTDETDGRPRPGTHAEVNALVRSLGRYSSVGATIESFWLDPAHRRADLWLEHRDINDVMLATNLAPEGFVRLR